VSVAILDYQKIDLRLVRLSFIIRSYKFLSPYTKGREYSLKRNKEVIKTPRVINIRLELKETLGTIKTSLDLKETLGTIETNKIANIILVD
jgi:hypothetical protein